MIKIGLLGGPSSGKSTLAAALFAELKEQKVKTEQIQEYAREHINKTGGISNILTQYLLHEKQSEKENIIPDKIDILVTDSPTILSLLYAIHYADPHDSDHQQMLVNLYEKFIKYDRLSYNYIFLLPSTSRPYVNDGTRSQTEKEAQLIGIKIQSLLTTHSIPYSILEMGQTKLRVKNIINLLKKNHPELWPTIPDWPPEEPHPIDYIRGKR